MSEPAPWTRARGLQGLRGRVLTPTSNLLPRVLGPLLETLKVPLLYLRHRGNHTYLQGCGGMGIKSHKSGSSTVTARLTRCPLQRTELLPKFPPLLMEGHSWKGYLQLPLQPAPLPRLGTPGKGDFPASVACTCVCLLCTA